MLLGFFSCTKSMPQQKMCQEPPVPKGSARRDKGRWNTRRTPDEAKARRRLVKGEGAPSQRRGAGLVDRGVTAALLASPCQFLAVIATQALPSQSLWQPLQELGSKPNSNRFRSKPPFLLSFGRRSLMWKLAGLRTVFPHRLLFFCFLLV